MGLGLLLRSVKGGDDEEYESYQPVYHSSPSYGHSASYGYGHARKGRARSGGRSAHGRRGRRSIGEETVFELEEMSREKAFSLVASFEPQQCIKRLVCGLSTGRMEADNTGIMSAFKV